jgi:hypothetical protein
MAQSADEADADTLETMRPSSYRLIRSSRSRRRSASKRVVAQHHRRGRRRIPVAAADGATGIR